VIIRPASQESDYVTVAAVATAASPDYPESAEHLREKDGAVHAGGGTQVRWLAEDRADAIGTAVLGHFTWCKDPTIQGLGIWVVPDRRGRGVGRALHETLLRAAEAADVNLLVGFVDGREARSRSFAVEAGYQVVCHGFESRVDPSTADVARFNDVLAAVDRAGIRIESLAELQKQEPDWLVRVAGLYARIEEDVPASVPTAPPTMEVFVAEAIGSASAIPEAFFIARDGERWIGLTEIRRSEDADLYDQELTGVLREYRRHGIATALKVRGLLWARDVGATRLRTWNDSRNEGMLAVNDLLGMERSHVILEYHRARVRVASAP
jgi:RimJ/RimL family protein N-acetyltransferase